jgi:predicted nucleotidyltransferase
METECTTASGVKSSDVPSSDVPSSDVPSSGGASALDEYAAYLPHIRRRWQAQQAAWQARQREAWSAAHEVAGLLRERFAAEQVIAFGSLVHPGRFTDRSDLDLAVSGIPKARFFAAWAAAMLSSAFELDLVDLADCSPALRDLIEREGVAL